MSVLNCKYCGQIPNFIIPDINSNDCYLECGCGRKTKDYGGFQYAHEISLSESKDRAFAEWNKMNSVR